MKFRRALVSFGGVTLLYLIALVWIGLNSQVFFELPSLLSLLPVLVGFSFLSYLVRYLRWYWLLMRAGNETKLFTGYLAYLAGFAFTVTPGKLGELVRIRYLTPQGVPAWRVLSAFVYERVFDLLAVLLLSVMVIGQNDIFVVGFVVIVIAVLAIIILQPGLLTMASIHMRFYRLNKLARVIKTLHDGLFGCRVWATLPDIVVSLFLGLLAWAITSYSFVWLLYQLGVTLPFLTAMSIYPLSMLTGAASMLPGGVGSTEVAIVGLLSIFDIPLGVAALAAIGIRFSSIWFAVFCGFIALGIMEIAFRRVIY